MKRFVLVAVLVGMLAMALAGTAFAQGPVQGSQPGIHTPGTGRATQPDGALAQPGTGFGPRGGMGMGMGGAPEWAGMQDEVETLLGMTDAEIQAERLAGKSLVQIASAKGVSEQQLTDAILGAKKADLDKLVTDGKLTQTQADYMYGRMQQQVPQMINRTTTGPAMGQGSNTQMGRRGMGRWNQ